MARTGTGADRTAFTSPASNQIETALQHQHESLPVALTPLIRRAHEVAVLSTSLEDDEIRLLTLVGPGGTGKTRLALEVAAETQSAFADGVCFVALAALADPTLVVTAITQALGLRQFDGQPLIETVTSYLRSRHLLLVLDNFEHLLAAATDVSTILGACPLVKALATSRAPLQIVGEHEFPVPSLRLPASDGEGQTEFTFEQVVQSEAVRLFVARARAVKPGFRLGVNNATAVAQICTRLDGLPLAIELAAIRVKLLAPQALCSRLHHALTLLTSGARDGLTRHQTLRSTIAWSHDLLNADEQQLFARLSVFAGGWRLEAAEAICGDTSKSVLDNLHGLINQSLVRHVEGADTSDEEPRFTMLETIREYAMEQLVQSGEQPTLRSRHAAYYLDLAETAEPGLRGRERKAWLRCLRAEHNNLRAALTWSQTDAANPSAQLRLAGALWWFWYFAGLLSEGRSWLETALERDTSGGSEVEAARARALVAVGFIAWTQGDLTRARNRCETAVGSYRALDDPRGLAGALAWFGVTVRWQTDSVSAHPYFEEASRIARQADDRWTLALTLWLMGDRYFTTGDEAYQRACLEESRRLFQEVGDNWGLAFALDGLGHLATQAKDFDAARALYAYALELRRELGDTFTMAWSLQSRGNLEHVAGDEREAERFYALSLALFQELGTRQPVVSRLLYWLGRLALLRQDYHRATGLFTEGLTSCRQLMAGRWYRAAFLAGHGGVLLAEGDVERAPASLQRLPRHCS